VLFSHDLFSLPPEKMKDAKVLMTVVDGKIVFEA
jgi:predicted amidohydrolase YtcJ